MAAIRQANIAPATGPVPEAPADPHTELARLAALHTEAYETAILANLLGRAPYAIAALALCAGLAAALFARSMPAMETTSWLVLMVIGLGAMARAYGQAIIAPFERSTLKAFTQDMTAITAYLGFAWGAGAFLVLPASSGLITALLFVAGAAALFTGILRDRDIAIAFVAPSATLSAMACILRPISNGAFGALLVVAASCAIAGAVVLAAHWLRNGRNQPRLQLG